MSPNRLTKFDLCCHEIGEALKILTLCLELFTGYFLTILQSRTNLSHAPPVLPPEHREPLLIDEPVLMQRARSGDMSAFREIVEHHKRMVYHLAVNMTGNSNDADDISQEVFLRAYRSMASFRGDAKVGSWLYRITINACLDHRSRKHSKLMELREDMESEKHGDVNNDRSTQPGIITASNVMQQHIDRALQRLTPRERSIFVLRHYNDLSMKEIAATLSVTIGTVKSTLFHAVEKLQKELSFYKDELGLEER